MRFIFKPFTAATIIIGVLIFTKLGFWQLDRMEQKEKLGMLVKNNSALPPTNSLHDLSTLMFRKVNLYGSWLRDKTFFLNLRKYRGKIGVYVITPLKLDDGKEILVNRGWIAHPPSRLDPPQITTESGKIKVSGILFPISSPKINFSKGLDKIRMYINYQELSKLHPQLLNALVKQTSVNLAGQQLQRSARLPDYSPQMHLGYAIQWFAFALILSGAGIYFCCLKRNSA